MFEEKSKPLRIVLILLTIIGGVATVFSCIIAYLAFVNPQRVEVILKQISSPITPTPVVITVIAPTPTPYPTYTPYPTQAPSPTPIPTPTSKPTPRPTPTPTPTTPPPGTVWEQDGVSLVLYDYEIRDETNPRSAQLLVNFRFTNNSGQAILLQYNEKDFKAVDDRGRGYPERQDIGWISVYHWPEDHSVWVQNRDKYEFVVCFSEAGRASPETRISKDTNYIIIWVDEFSRIRNAKWCITIPR